MRKILALAVAVGIALFGLTSCGSSAKTTSPAASSSSPTSSTPTVAGSTTTAATSAPTPPSIPLTATSSEAGQVVVVDVAIAGKPLRVLLDTGSYGLRVVAAQVPPGAVQRTGPAPGYGYATGVTISGDLAQASVQIAGHDTAGPIPIELVTDTGCAADRPDCPAAGGKKPVMFGGRFDGIMGVSMRPVDGLVNPLWRLPNGLGQVFGVHYDPAGTSTLLLSPPEAGFSLVHLDKGSPANVPDGPPPWIPEMPGCFTLAALPGGKSCGPTVFDTGTSTIQIVAADAHAGAVPAGTQIGMSVGNGAFTHTYTTDPGTRAEVRAAGSNSIAGLPSFTATDIRYDLPNGTIGFRPY